MIARALSPWVPLPPDVWLRGAATQLPFPLEDARSRRFRRGRTALWHGVRALGLERGEEVLVPAYHHGAEIEALVRAGLVPRFYSTRPGLLPDVDELESMLGPRTRALLVIHVLGLAQPVSTYRCWCDERGLLLLEDVAQGWLSEHEGAPVGSDADLALFCLYKTFGVPDGAAVLVRDGVLPHPREPDTALPAVAKAHAAWVAQRSGLIGTGWTWARSRRNSRFDLAREIALGDTSAAMSRTAERLLARLVATPAAAIRRTHYGLLLERLGELVPEEMPELNSGAAPFAFPVLTADKARLLGRLASVGIHALDYWSVPHPALEQDRDPVASRLRRRVVGLPLHQELLPGDLDRIAAAVLALRRASSG